MSIQGDENVQPLYSPSTPIIPIQHGEKQNAPFSATSPHPPLFKLKRPNVETNGYSNRKCCRSSHLQISSMPIGRIKSKQGLRSVNDPPWQGQGHESDAEMRSVTGQEGFTYKKNTELVHRWSFHVSAMLIFTMQFSQNTRRAVLHKYIYLMHQHSNLVTY